MSNDLSLPASFATGAVSQVFGGAPADNDELGAGVTSSYGILGFKGKVWSIRHGGNDMVLMRDDGDGPRNSVEVVLIKASPAISKIYYKSGYVDGSNAAPDCFSSNGQTPDPSVQNKVHPTCADCPMNAWGSRISDSGKQNKACSDSRRVAISPLADIDNDLFGGPMLLRIPAASLKDLKSYGDVLNGHQYPYYAVATRISFDTAEAYPKFVFSAIRPLNDIEAKQVMALRDDKRISAVLNEATDPQSAAAAAAAAPAVKSSPFEEDQGATSAGNTEADQQAAQAAAKAKTDADAKAAQEAAAQQAARDAAKAKAEADAKAQAAAQSQGGKPNPFGATAPAENVNAPDTAQTTAASQASTTAPDTTGATTAAADDQDGTPDSFDDMLDKVLG